MRYRSNPVLNADCPDPDLIRVGEDFWMIASSFNRAPGLPVLRSRDLMTWEHVTNALPAVPPLEHFSLPRRGGGVWAPSIREHDGHFYLVYPDPDHGILVLEASHPAGPWSAPWLLVEGRGMIDPCPVWDEDGTAYLVHGWARSRAGVKNRLTVLEVTEDLRRPCGPGSVVIDGDEIDGMRTLEGPKAYRKDGWYWIYAPAGGVAGGHQVVFRSRRIWGPYEHRIVLAQGDGPVNGPHQGGLVDDVEGAWWFVHFQDRGVFGRVTHVQPVTFDADAWPHMGEPIDDVCGRPVLEVPPVGSAAAVPAGEAPFYSEPVRSDAFETAELLPHWHWQSNPDPSWARTGAGTLDLGFAFTPRGDLRDLGAILGQQLPGLPSTWTTTVTLLPVASSSAVGNAPDERAGIVVLGLGYAWAGLHRTSDGVSLESGTMDQDGHTEQIARSIPIPPRDDGSAQVCLDLETDNLGTVRITASPSVPAATQGSGSDTPSVLLSDWQAVPGRWIGAEIGLFAATTDPVRSRAGGPRASFGPLAVRIEGRDA